MDSLSNDSRVQNQTVRVFQEVAESFGNFWGHKYLKIDENQKHGTALGTKLSFAQITELFENTMKGSSLTNLEKQVLIKSYAKITSNYIKTKNSFWNRVAKYLGKKSEEEDKQISKASTLVETQSKTLITDIINNKEKTKEDLSLLLTISDQTLSKLDYQTLNEVWELCQMSSLYAPQVKAELFNRLMADFKFQGFEIANLDDKTLKEMWQLCPVDSPNAPLVKGELFARLMDQVYHQKYGINANRGNLEKYIQSEDFIRHQQSVEVLYPGSFTPEEAQGMATQRVPVDIERDRYFDSTSANNLLGHNTSYFEENADAVATRGPVSIYSKTFLWNPPGCSYGEKIEVGILSTYGPALDSIKQPGVGQFIMGESVEGPINDLNEDAFRDYMQVMMQGISQIAASKDHKRVVIPLVSLGVFINLLNEGSKKKAYEIFQETLAEAINSNKDGLKGKNIVISEYAEGPGKGISEELSKQTGLEIGHITGDIKDNAENGDLIVNAWDPHSAPGNGNEGDNSLDGHLGRSTGMLLTQTNWFNGELNNPEHYKPIA